MIILIDERINRDIRNGKMMGRLSEDSIKILTKQEIRDIDILRHFAELKRTKILKGYSSRYTMSGNLCDVYYDINWGDIDA